MIMIAMLKVHSIALYQTLCSIKLRSATGVHSFWTLFRHFGTLCTVQSCWTRHSVQRDAMRFQHCNHHHQLTAQVKTTGKYIHTFGKFTRLFLLLRKKKIPRFWLLFQGKKMFIFSFFSFLYWLVKGCTLWGSSADDGSAIPSYHLWASIIY